MASGGRQRYRWLLLLLVAGLLLAWLLVDGTQGDSDADGSAAPSGTSSVSRGTAIVVVTVGRAARRSATTSRRS